MEFKLFVNANLSIQLFENKKPFKGDKIEAGTVIHLFYQIISEPYEYYRRLLHVEFKELDLQKITWIVKVLNEMKTFPQAL